MAGHIDTKFSFLNAHCGPGARRGHQVMVPTPLERSRSSPSMGNGTIRGLSLPGHGIPAGYSHILGNRLGLAAYANLNGRYVAKMDVPAPCPAPRPHPKDRARQVEERWLAPERMKPETMPPAGGKVERLRGKRLIEDNTNYLSNSDTLIFGRDIDGSFGCRYMAHSITYAGSAGQNAKVERDPAWGVEPPVCKRTFGETDADNNWNAVQYERLDPRRDFAEPVPGMTPPMTPTDHNHMLLPPHAHV